MSLHKFAEQVAAHGRGDDSLLVHMTPDEVRKLQQFAEANGTTLTINPHTGLPEAGLLSDFFKMVAPVALGAFLGPAGMGITFGGLSSAASAGLLTGGITTLATGSLSRGLMAGLGAYGGAGLAGGVANAGESLIGSAAEGIQGPIGSPESGFGATQAIAAAPKSEILSSGLGAITKSPEALGTFAKQNLGNIAAAAAPIMAGAMVPTTTKMPENTSPAYIRQKLYDPYTQTYKSLAPVKASEWGSRSFSDAYTNPQTGEMATFQTRAPGMAGGGIVALAKGGVPGYAGGALVSDKQIFDYFANPTPGRTDADIARDMQTYNVTAADIARATGTGARQGEYETRFVQAINKPDTSAAEFQAMTSDVGLQGQALANAMQNAGMSAAAQYASTHNLTDTKAPQTDFYNQFGYTVGALPGDQGGLEGLYANINYSAKGLQDQINAGKLTVSQAQNLALAEMDRVGVNQRDIKAATGKDFGNLFTPKPVTPPPPPPTTITPGETKLDTATTYDNGAFGNYGSGPATGVDYLGRTVSIATPGDIITNPDQTRTVVPNIPGRPYGGFTGMDQVKSAYTAGGGSLGYTAKAPRTIAEFDQLYNKQTGDSLAAYNYLMGKGAYPIQSQAADSATGIMRPYWSAGMKYKPKFLTANKDGTVTASSTNPNAAGAATPSGTLAAKTIYVTNNRGESEEATLGSDGNYHTSGGDTYDVAGKQLAAGGGLMSLAGGGMPGYAGNEGSLVNDEQVFNYFKGLDQSKLNSGALDAQIAADMQKYKVNPEDIARITGTQDRVADYQRRFAAQQPVTTGGLDTLAANQTATADANAAAKLGVFQTVYDPKTGREFNSPAQAAQYGVTDYVTQMPMKLEFMNDTSRKAVIDAMAGGMTFDQAINSLGGQYGMSGKDFYNYEVQGGLRSADTAPIQEAIKTASGNLTPDQLIAKLQAYKDKPPTTAQEFRDQQALYADYANRYANSSWNYANMGGKAQDYSLKPQDYLATKFTGYAEPINFALSNMNQMSPDYKEMSKILTANPEISAVIDQLYKINPEASVFNYINPKYAGGTDKSTMARNFNNAVIKNLAGDIERFGKDAAMRRFLGSQQNLLSLSPDAQGNLGNFNQVSMANPTYAAYNDLLNKYTPTVADEDWNKQAVLGAPKGTSFSEPYRDPTTGKGLSLVYQNGNPVGVRFIDQSGIGNVVYNDPAKLIEAAYESGIPLSAFNEIAKKVGSDVLIPSQRGLRDGDYFPEGLKNGVKFSDIASGNLAKTIASDDWLKFMIADAQAKNTNPEDYAGGLNYLIEKYRNQNKAAKDYLKKLGYAGGGMTYAMGGGLGSLGSYSDGGRLLRGPGDGVSDSIPATIGANKQPARLADGEFVVPARIVSELGNGSTEAGAKKLYAMMDRVQKARGKTTGKNKVAANTRADKYLPA